MQAGIPPPELKGKRELIVKPDVCRSECFWE